MCLSSVICISLLTFARLVNMAATWNLLKLACCSLHRRCRSAVREQLVMRRVRALLSASETDPNEDGRHIARLEVDTGCLLCFHSEFF